MKVVAALVLLSFAATQVFANLDPAANFYLLPSRFWELGVGALLALVGVEKLDLSKGSRELLSALGLLAIVASYLFVVESAFYPGWTTVPVVLGTALVLAFGRSDTVVGRLLSLKPLVAIGLISYSLYLWHQPVFAFARLRSIEDIPAEGYALLIALCFVLAYLSWRLVEQPFRKPGRFSRRAVLAPRLRPDRRRSPSASRSTVRTVSPPGTANLRSFRSRASASARNAMPSPTCAAPLTRNPRSRSGGFLRPAPRRRHYRVEAGRATSAACQE